MNNELDGILKNRENLDDYLSDYGHNSLFLYNYYLQNTRRILSNFYAYGGYLEVPDKIKLINKLLEGNINYEMINYLLSDLVNYYLDDKYKNEINVLFEHLLELDKENRIDLRLIGIKGYIYCLDPVYAINKDINEINDINVTDKDTLIKVLNICHKKKYIFTGSNSLFIEYRVFDDIDILIHFINCCKFDEYCRGLITAYFDTLDKESLHYIHEKITDADLLEFISVTLNFDNYDINTLVNDSTIYLMANEHKDDIINTLLKIKEKGFTTDVVLVVDRVDMDFVDKAYDVLGEQIKISPLMNQEHKRVFDGPWDFPYYSVSEIKNSERTLNLYANTTKDRVDRNGNLKQLSPFEKFVAAYILTTKFAPYNEEKDEYNEYHTSRSVYEFIDKTNDRKIVCVGYVHLLQELLFRMGIYDTIRWDVHSTEEEERSHTQGDNHARMLIHLVDPKYNIDGVYMSDPTWDERGLHDICIKHMLMAKEEIRRIDPEFSPSDLHLYRVNEIKNGLGVKNLGLLFNKPINKDAIIKAFIRVYRFLDQEKNMDDEITDIEYHEMAIKLGFESKYDEKKIPSFNDLKMMDRNLLNYYFEVYPELIYSYLTDLRDDLKKYINSIDIDLPMRITSKGITIDLEISLPYLKYLEDLGYHIRYGKNKAFIDIYAYSDEPMFWQYQKIVDKLYDFKNVIDRLSSENEMKGLK